MIRYFGQDGYVAVPSSHFDNVEDNLGFGLNYDESLDNPYEGQCPHFVFELTKYWRHDCGNVIVPNTKSTKYPHLKIVIPNEEKAKKEAWKKDRGRAKRKAKKEKGS